MKTTLHLSGLLIVSLLALPTIAAPPKVKQATPANGAKDVDPGLKQLRIVFDQPMSPDGCSVAGGGTKFPKLVGSARWENDRTFVWSWKLEPEHDYWLSINSERFTKFRSVNGEPATPYPVAFRTAKGVNGSSPGKEAESTSPNDFLQRGIPTFVLGTAGDERSDRAISAQVELVRSMFFPGAKVVDDQAIDVTKGSAAWPRKPVLYGGPHVNTLLARLTPTLPFSMQHGKLTLGAEVFESDDYRLIAVIPARGPDAKGPGYPEFLLYAGTGSPGIAEINAVQHGTQPILIADTFGSLLAGEWQRTKDGQLKPCFPRPRARRIAWRTVSRDLQFTTAANNQVHARFPEQLPPSGDEEQDVSACLRGLSQIITKLAITNPVPVTIYI